MKKLLRAAIAKQEEYIEISEHNQNPQVVAMVIEAKAKRDAYEAVLAAINGDKLWLRMDSE